jgi:ferredoxin
MMVFATREALEDELGRLNTENAALLADLEAAERREKALVEGLQRYGLHLYSDCLGGRACVCGLTALLAPQPAEPAYMDRLEREKFAEDAKIKAGLIRYEVGAPPEGGQI